MCTCDKVRNYASEGHVIEICVEIQLENGSTAFKKYGKKCVPPNQLILLFGWLIAGGARNSPRKAQCLAMFTS